MPIPPYLPAPIKGLNFLYFPGFFPALLGTKNSAQLESLRAVVPFVVGEIAANRPEFKSFPRERTVQTPPMIKRRPKRIAISTRLKKVAVRAAMINTMIVVSTTSRREGQTTLAISARAWAMNCVGVVFVAMVGSDPSYHRGRYAGAPANSSPFLPAHSITGHPVPMFCASLPKSQRNRGGELPDGPDLHGLTMTNPDISADRIARIRAGAPP
jgi:hypothetical protein